MRFKVISLTLLLLSVLLISGCLSESVEINVVTEGSWNGSCVPDHGETVYLSGEGPATVPLGTDPGDVACTFYKTDSSADRMVVSLYRGEKLLVEGNTSVPNGMVVFSCNIPTGRYELKSHTDGPKEYLLNVWYEGPWEAEIPSEEGTRSVNGTGWQTYFYNSSDLSVRMGARKLDTSNNSLTIGIHDAHFRDLAVNSTSEPNGSVSVSYVLEPDLIFRSGVKISVSSEERWKGRYDVDGNYTSIEGFGEDETYYPGDVSGTIRLSVRKTGDDDEPLSVNIEKDGMIVNSGETSVEYGNIVLRAEV
ncbi:hypothetical protein RJ40_02965 [Methanofollis aquaemaris]|uniref:Uncharacterized protein n=1 Tax=Methanofollis aquaemaris TaxID=126734 RepID=A0A8A3S4J7_9EURY|nr:hypothetical protein [Methanofollis aquaemaris]QSZ66534.1 hypothetical protein RJ40_02965 [Methanofollis aquaemaris]